MGYIPNDLTDLANYPLVDATRIYQDLIALDNLLSGNLTQDNISPLARFALANLATPYVTEDITLSLPIQATVVSGYHASMRLQSSALYTILSGWATWNGIGGTPASGNTYQVMYGSYSSSGFASAGNIIAATNWYNVGASAGQASATLATTQLQGPTTLVLYLPAVATPPSGGHLDVTLQTITFLR